MAVQRVREGAEKAKIELSSTVSTDINLPFITADATGPKHLTMTITRAKLEDLVGPIIERCKHPMEQALNDAKLTAKEVDRIIMVGGPTRMPMCKNLLKIMSVKKLSVALIPWSVCFRGGSASGDYYGDVKMCCFWMLLRFL